MTSVAPVTQRGNPRPRRADSAYPQAKLTPQQARQWGETLAAVNWLAPGFTHLLYTMMIDDDGITVAHFSEAIPCVAATDGTKLLFKPSEFFALTLMERVFAVCHEISHCVGDHCGMGYTMKKRGYIMMGNKKLPYDPMHSNIVQDLIINDMLIESKFGTFKKGWLWDKTKATYMDDWVEVYFKTWKKPKPPIKPPPQPPGDKPCEEGQPGDQPGEQGTQPGNSPTQPGPGQFDQHLDPGAADDLTPEETPARNEQEWQQAVAGAIAVAQAQGKSSAAFDLHFGKMLEPVVDWREHLRSLVARKVGSGGFDFRRPDRRLIVRDIIAPGRSGHGAGLIIEVFDTSGSIFVDPTLIDRFKGETVGILQDVRPKELRLVECDAEIKRVTELEDPSDMLAISVVKGGGGTDFRPVFQWIEDEGLKPDCVLYLTDGDGDFPAEAPKYPVIWGDISGNAKKYPFGDVVEIPTE